MNKKETEQLIQYVLRLGDDALVLGQRLIEWCSKAPFLEEDLAIGNTALDFIGRARMFYGYAAELSGGDKTEDDFAFTRDCREFSNCLLYELPRGDFAFTYVRQFYIDTFDCLLFEAMCSSKDQHLAAIAGKVIKESRYHFRHSKEWILRLGDGTEQSNHRLQNAIDDLSDFIDELFEVDQLLEQLQAQGIAVNTAQLKDQWYNIIGDTLKEAKVQMAEPNEWHQTGGRTGVHTEHLGHLLSELQFMQRAYPGLEW